MRIHANSLSNRVSRTVLASTSADGQRTSVVLGRTLAVRLFGAPERAVGRALDASVFGQPFPVLVVGVVEDVIDSDLRSDPHPKMYVAMPGSPQSFTTLLVRTDRPMDALAADVRTVLGGIDPNVPLGSVSSQA